MNTLNLVILIRILFVLGMISLMVLVGAFLARRRASTPDRGAMCDRAPEPVTIQATRRYRVHKGYPATNDCDVSAPHAQGRAA